MTPAVARGPRTESPAAPSPAAQQWRPGMRRPSAPRGAKPASPTPKKMSPDKAPPPSPERAAVEPQADPTERLVAISTAYVGYWLDHPDHYRLVFMAEGVTQPDVSLFVDDPELVARFGVFVEALAQASARELTGVEQKTKLDLLLCMLHGIAHNSVTISGYPWTAPGDLVREGVRGLVAVRG